MKYLFIFISFFSTFLYSQTKPNTDSLSYYNKSTGSDTAVNVIDKSNYKSSYEFLNFQKAMSFKSLKKYDLASKTLKKIIQRPDNLKTLAIKSESYYQLGLIEVLLKRSDSAIFYFNKALDSKDRKSVV